MMLSDWAKRWGVSVEAANELRQLMNTGMLEPVGMVPVVGREPLSEGAVQNNARLEFAQAGARLMRNNVGACQDKTGRLIRYGLCNDSKAMNEEIKSSDLIGIQSVLITDDHVGSIIGKFIARECKYEGWVFKGTDHENAQLNFHKFINAYGGDARFLTGPGTL